MPYSFAILVASFPIQTDGEDSPRLINDVLITSVVIPYSALVAHNLIVCDPKGNAFVESIVKS